MKYSNNLSYWDWWVFILKHLFACLRFIEPTICITIHHNYRPLRLSINMYLLHIHLKMFLCQQDHWEDGAVTIPGVLQFYFTQQYTRRGVSPPRRLANTAHRYSTKQENPSTFHIAAAAGWFIVLVVYNDLFVSKQFYFRFYWHLKLTEF